MQQHIFLCTIHWAGRNILWQAIFFLCCMRCSFFEVFRCFIMFIGNIFCCKNININIFRQNYLFYKYLFLSGSFLSLFFLHKTFSFYSTCGNCILDTIDFYTATSCCCCSIACINFVIFLSNHSPNTFHRTIVSAHALDLNAHHRIKR